MTGLHQETKDIGRFIRARRVATLASNRKEIPQRRRHVPYLTQNDLAELLDVSTVVVSQIEQGKYPNLTESMLERVAHTLAFTQQQKMYMFGLLARRSPVQLQNVVVPQWMQDSITDASHPTLIISPAYDLLKWNSAMDILFNTFANNIFASGNALISAFVESDMERLFVDWDEYARSMVSGLRMSYAVHADMRDYILDLANNLSDQNQRFAELWNEDDPLVVPTIEKEIAHPSLGRLNVIQVITVVVEAPKITKVDFLPANDETRDKLATACR